MYQTNLWREITTSVQHIMDVRLDLLSEGSVVQRSDALLATLPVRWLPCSSGLSLRLDSNCDHHRDRIAKVAGTGLLLQHQMRVPMPGA